MEWGWVFISFFIPFFFRGFLAVWAFVCAGFRPGFAGNWLSHGKIEANLGLSVPWAVFEGPVGSSGTSNTMS
jgi:hypothetical protein